MIHKAHQQTMKSTVKHKKMNENHTKLKLNGHRRTVTTCRRNILSVSLFTLQCI